MKKLYQHLTTRLNNPLAHKQAMIAVAVKMMKIMLPVCKKREMYDSNIVGNKPSNILLVAGLEKRSVSEHGLHQGNIS
mgnify:CR=1 FL=1|jgi:hypothetical protein